MRRRASPPPGIDPRVPAGVVGGLFRSLTTHAIKKIDGLPSDFDGWVFEVVARAVPQLMPDERPEVLCQAIFDLGAAAQDWLERFFWAWFTTGLRVARSLTEFVRICLRIDSPLSGIRYALWMSRSSAHAVSPDLRSILKHPRIIQNFTPTGPVS